MPVHRVFDAHGLMNRQRELIQRLDPVGTPWRRKAHEMPAPRVHDTQGLMKPHDNDLKTQHYQNWRHDAGQK